MTLEMVLDEKYEAGREEGREEGKMIGTANERMDAIRRMKRFGLTTEEIRQMQYTDEEIEEALSVTAVV